MDEETEQEEEVEQEGSLQELPQESLQQEDKQTVNIDTGVFSLLNPLPSGGMQTSGDAGREGVNGGRSGTLTE